MNKLLSFLSVSLLVFSACTNTNSIDEATTKDADGYPLRGNVVSYTDTVYAVAYNPSEASLSACAANIVRVDYNDQQLISRISQFDFNGKLLVQTDRTYNDHKVLVKSFTHTMNADTWSCDSYVVDGQKIISHTSTSGYIKDGEQVKNQEEWVIKYTYKDDKIYKKETYRLSDPSDSLNAQTSFICTHKYQKDGTCIVDCEDYSENGINFVERYDEKGRIVEVKNIDGVVSYKYDKYGQLVESGLEHSDHHFFTYTLDDKDNWTSRVDQYKESNDMNSTWTLTTRHIEYR